MSVQPARQAGDLDFKNLRGVCQRGGDVERDRRIFIAARINRRRRQGRRVGGGVDENVETDHILLPRQIAQHHVDGLQPVGVGKRGEGDLPGRRIDMRAADRAWQDISRCIGGKGQLIGRRFRIADSEGQGQRSIFGDDKIGEAADRRQRRFRIRAPDRFNRGAVRIQFGRGEARPAAQDKRT